MTSDRSITASMYDLYATAAPLLPPCMIYMRQPLIVLPACVRCALTVGHTAPSAMADARAGHAEAVLPLHRRREARARRLLPRRCVRRSVCARHGAGGHGAAARLQATRLELLTTRHVHHRAEAPPVSRSQKQPIVASSHLIYRQRIHVVIIAIIIAMVISYVQLCRIAWCASSSIYRVNST
jgi:hypothetical protein